MRYDDFLRKACPPLDLEWRKYRRRAARHRLNARIAELGLKDYGEYLQRLRADPHEADALPDWMRVTVTRFYREREIWDLLKRKVLPELLESAQGKRPFKAWSVGCCGGEEPYSLATLWLYGLPPESSARPIRILATDIDPDALERADRAVYTRSSLREVPEHLLRRAFRREGDFYHLAPEVRGVVVLRMHNLMTDPPPVEMDLVLARYLPFTYYTGLRRRQAAERLWQALRPGGALMIGLKERLSPRELEFFEPWPETEGLFFRSPGEGG
jgi:chemotaxis methyl-accepting protein methylase